MNCHLLILAALATLSLPCSANLHRGLWFWQNGSSPYGSTNIVGNTTQEIATITFIKSHGIRRLYGSYGARPINEPNVIAAWNQRLHNSGIQSQLLLSENSSIFPGTDRDDLLDNIDQRLINFNTAPGRTTAQKFDALHLDIEPQGLANWESLTDAQQRDHLFLLRDTYADVRQHLTDNGLPGFPIYADLPVWFDSYPGGSIGWDSATQRDDWFTAISVSLTGITLMPFDRDSFSSINSGVSWERSNITLAQVRCGIEADIGLGATWSSVPVYNAMMTTLEDNYGIGGAVDIQSYRLWREALDAQPLIWVEAELTPVNSDWIISFQTKPSLENWTYILTQSNDMCRWKQVHELTAPREPQATFRVTNAPSDRAFWRVERYQPSRDIVAP